MQPAIRPAPRDHLAQALGGPVTAPRGDGPNCW